MPVSLLNKLQQVLALSRDEQQAVQALPSRIRMVDPQEDIVSDGDPQDHVSLISEGFACRYKLLKSGRRQIIGFLIPGDMCDLRALLVHHMDHRVAALCRCRIAVIPRHRLLEAIEKHPRLALALWCDTIFDAAIYHEWLTNIGGRMAYERLAHLLCEIGFRLKRAGHAQDASYDLPVTQADIGDALGLSVVHVNRTLKRLRMDGLVKMQNNVVTVLDWSRLQEAAEFDPMYMRIGPLHTRPMPAL